MLDRELVAIDLETTGLSPRLDQVIEVGAVRFRGTEVLECFEALVNPGRAIPLAVQRLTGITNYHVEGASSPEDALEKLKSFVGETAVVGHGAHFDLAFLSARDDASFELYDTLDLARILLPTVASHSLPLLTRSLELSHPRAHRALADADAARQLFQALFAAARDLPGPLLDRMLTLLADWRHPLRTFLAAARAAGPADRPAPAAPAQAPPVLPRRDAPAFSSTSLPVLLGAEGPMGRAHPNFELREGQQQMALAIGQTFERGGRLLVEAGPGTGKSIAYLVPALLWARAHNERVLVSTNTITLQEQLAHKDLPALRQWLPVDFQAAVVKGRRHYLSKRRWAKFLQTPTRQEDGRRAAEEMKFKLRLLVWLSHAAAGDRSEIRLGGSDEQFWGQVASDPDDCLSIRCPTYRTCFFWNSRRAAQAADLVLTNHALLLADSRAGGGILPAHEHLIIDEAHHLEEAATQSLTVRLTETEWRIRLQDALRWAGALQSPGAVRETTAREARAVEEGIHEVFRALGELVASHEAAAGNGEVRLAFDSVTRETPQFDLVARPVQALARPWQALALLLEAASAQTELPLEASDVTLATHELALHASVVRARHDMLCEAVLNPRPDRVYWAYLDRGTGRPVLAAAPLDVGTLLREQTFKEKQTVVLTSASLSLRNSFDFFKSRVGLQEASVEELTLPSPFDYLSQALLCLPMDVPDPDDPALVGRVSQVVQAVGTALQGRTLVLFTSHAQLKEVYDLVEAPLAAEGIVVLGQNLDGTRRQVVQQFLEHPRTILLGSGSFWEGVDLRPPRAGPRGEAARSLACVMIVRLPFKVPSDPIQVARGAALQDPFGGLALPEAILRLKQGFGRLIRRQSDRGAVILLDNRVANKAYGRHFLDALPRAAYFTGGCADVAAAVQEWLDRGVLVSAR